MSSNVDDAKRMGRQADDSDWLEMLARAGLIAFGVVHLVLGWLSVQLALGDREGSASTSGAVQELSQQPFGKALVWAVAVGMFLLVIWQGIEAVVGHREEEGKDLIRKRVTSAGKTVLYAVIGVSAVKAATGSSSGGGEKQSDSMTAQVMNWPGGQILVGLVALGILVVAGFLIHRGLTDGFLKKMKGSGRTGYDGTAYKWAGRVGYTAKGVSLGIVGVLFGYAAITHESKKSGGLDAALTKVLDQPFGPVVIVLIGLGFACYGIFCFAWSRHFNQ